MQSTAHGPLGPWLTTRDEVGDPHGLRLQTWVNGELRQDSSTKQLIFDCFALVEYLSTAFTLSIEAREGVTTGISAADRARTVQVAIDPKASRADLSIPGHIFPLMAREGGVLVRAGHTEAGVELARLAGLNPSAVICEIMNDDGTMARLPDLVGFAQRHGLKIAKIADLISYRLRSDRLRAAEHEQRGQDGHEKCRHRGAPAADCSPVPSLPLGAGPKLAFRRGRPGW